MSSKDQAFKYLSDSVSFNSTQASFFRTLYFPLCSTHSSKIKSAITPFLSGDVKLDKLHYLTKPASREDLRGPVRNFFIDCGRKGIISLAEDEGQSPVIEIGQLWHKLIKKFSKQGLKIEALNFIPVSGEDLELMYVTVENISRHKITITPVAAIPIFGRALANKHDHEHVTALLHRTKQLSYGVLVEPSMMFHEEGHKISEQVYYVFGVDEKGKKPKGSFPTIDNFCGERGNLSYPQAVYQREAPKKLLGASLDGKEAVGALCFSPKTLNPGQKFSYIIALGVAKNQAEAQKAFCSFDSLEKIERALERNEEFWFEKSHSIEFQTGDCCFDSWMHWVTIQPVLRRIFGCSFLPDHDYGKGGKGWRDIWQDLLSLILIEPELVRNHLINNFGGVRMDGSNATIVGSHPGEFIADRNAISRVWMDHGVWPLTTLLLYIHQTGDFTILLEENTYFRDLQFSRSQERDSTWSPSYGRFHKDHNGKVYRGTVLEHILIEHLVQFFNVGSHNIIRLESADWNDGLDMAFDEGESVTFMSFYGGNFLQLADLLEILAVKKNLKTVRLAKEISILLDTLSSSSVDYNSAEAKRELLWKAYIRAVQPELSGEQVSISIEDLVSDLRKKGTWIFNHIRKQEKMDIKEKKNTFTWFNGYYDNKKTRVEGLKDNQIRMTLTGQVFPIMSGLASDAEIKQIVESVRRYLKDKKLGGFRLNTDFQVKHYLDLGRAFGFAYGTKENGAFFNHMIVMYAYALYKRGFAHEGHEVLHSIYQMCSDMKRSKIYPGVPEYFDSEGRGMYHYLTGSASWLVLTELTQVFGVRGHHGDLLLSPKLVREQFAKDNKASVSCKMAGKKIFVEYVNAKALDYGQYAVLDVFCNDHPVAYERLSPLEVMIPRANIEKMPPVSIIQVVLDKADKVKSV